MYDARQVANWFIQRAATDGRKLSIMQLLKLVYISHGWHLEITGSPLINNRIEAWRHGPVIPDVYNVFRPQGVYVDKQAPLGYSAIPDTVGGFLEEIYRLYGRKSPFELSDITHVAGGPWDTATKMYGWFAPISNDSIKSHYQQLRSHRADVSA